MMSNSLMTKQNLAKMSLSIGIVSTALILNVIIDTKAARALSAFPGGESVELLEPLESNVFPFNTTANSVIISPTSGVINSGGPGFGTLTETINQSGLFLNFVSGVTDFDTYLATNPLHTPVFDGFEWFSESGTTEASVTYDLGSLINVDRLALWNEESSGIGTLDLFSSSDGINFAPLALGLTPTDNPVADYLADVFSFGSVNARYIRFDISDCPQPNPGSFPACAIGEVAFREVSSSPIPEPSSLLSFLTLGTLGTVATFKRKLKR